MEYSSIHLSTFITKHNKDIKYNRPFRKFNFTFKRLKILYQSKGKTIKPISVRNRYYTLYVQCTYIVIVVCANIKPF